MFVVQAIAGRRVDQESRRLGNVYKEQEYVRICADMCEYALQFARFAGP